MVGLRRKGIGMSLPLQRVELDMAREEVYFRKIFDLGLGLGKSGC
jgi:hypothetical protein